MAWEATPDESIELRGTIFDLARRVTLLEQGLHGHARPQMSLVLMLRCYREAHAALRGIDTRSAAAWVAQAYLWDVRMLMSLGRAATDPFPFRPFLAVLDVCVLHSIPEAPEALAYLEAVSQDLLSASGLELVRPRDVMRRLQMHEIAEHVLKL